MIYPALHKFAFHRNGHSNRRDADAEPQNLVVGLDFDHHEVLFHPAGDDFVRTRCVIDAIRDQDFMEGFCSMDAVRVALEYARAGQIKADREIAAVKDGAA